MSTRKTSRSLCAVADSSAWRSSAAILMSNLAVVPRGTLWSRLARSGTSSIQRRVRKGLPKATFRRWLAALGVEDEEEISSLRTPWPTAKVGQLPPEFPDEAVSPDGPWGAAARGVEIRECPEEGKGRGAYAVRTFQAGEFIGIYWGELLTQREFALRHGWKSWHMVEPESERERLELAERSGRLSVLTPETGLPIGGERNGGTYCFELVPPNLSVAGNKFRDRCGRGEVNEFSACVAYIDGEDPNLSSWCRYINHAKASERNERGEPMANCTATTNAEQCLVWFEAVRKIETGEELMFTYYESNWLLLVVYLAAALIVTFLGSLALNVFLGWVGLGAWAPGLGAWVLD